jgi:hypothetical protein
LKLLVHCGPGIAPLTGGAAIGAPIDASERELVAGVERVIAG